MSPLSLLLIFVCVKTIYSDECPDTGIKFFVSDEAIKLAQSHYLPKYIEKPLKMDDFNVNKHFDFIGTIKLSLTNNQFVLTELPKENLKVEFIDNENKILVKLDSAKGHINFDYLFDSNFYKNVDKGRVKITNFSMQLENALKEVQNIVEPSK